MTTTTKARRELSRPVTCKGCGRPTWLKLFSVCQSCIDRALQARRVESK